MTTFPELRDIGLHLGSRSAILDGEIVALDKDNRPSFATLSKRLHVESKTAIEKLRRSTPASFFAFDLLYLEGRTLTRLPYDERRTAARLAQAATARRSRRLRRLRTLRARRCCDIAEERGLEGVVIKRRSAPYSPGSRNGDWIKVKNFRTQEVVIGGWTDGKGDRDGSLGALLLGVNTEEGLAYVGKGGHRLLGGDSKGPARPVRLPWLERRRPFSSPLSPAETALAHFVRPSLVGRGSVRGVDEGRESFASRPGVDFDLTRARRRWSVSPERVLTEIDGRELSLSNLDKVLYPETGFTKSQVLDYYARVAEVMLAPPSESPNHPTPLSQRGRRRCPFTKSTLPPDRPDWIRTIDVPSKSGEHEPIDYTRRGRSSDTRCGRPISRRSSSTSRSGTSRRLRPCPLPRTTWSSTSTPGPAPRSSSAVAWHTGSVNVSVAKRSSRRRAARRVSSSTPGLRERPGKS